MRKLAAIAMLGVMLVAPSAHAAPNDPTGGTITITSGPGPYQDGQAVTFTVGPITHVNNNYETTLAINCLRPDNTEVPVGDQWVQHQGKSIYLAEWNTFGGFEGNQPAPFQLYYGGDYTCRARVAVIKWFKGVPVQSWMLDEKFFTVDNP